ncbi:MAG TPA: vWA domain-containing protein [Blastocatellia bacterium]|nr:vWA domain-containing protein [Blastocatellia bacterium]
MRLALSLLHKFRLPRASLVLACILLLTPAARGRQGDLSTLNEKFGKAGLRADFVIVLDTSGSMRAFWDTVKSSIADFIDSIPDGDYVSILYFDAQAGDLVTPRQVTSENRAAFRQQVLDLAPPSGGFTDLGQGINRTLDELNRPNANPLQFVFTFTDFAHDPPQASAWRSRSCSGAAWRDLQAKKRRLVDDQGHVVKSYALKLPIGGHVGRDLGLFECVFSNVEQVQIVDRASLRDWFDRRRAEIARDKIKIQAEDEIKNRGVEVSLADASPFETGPGKESQLRLVLRSRLKALDVRLSGLALSINDDRYRATSPGEDVILAPGETREVAFTVNNSSEGGCFIEKSEPLSLTAGFTAASTFLPEGELKVLNLDPVRPVSAAINIDARVVCGYPLWQILLAGLLVAGAAVFSGIKLWDSFKPAYLEGLIQDEARPVGGRAVQRRFKRRERLKEVSIGSAESDIELHGAESEARIKLIARREPKRGVYIQLLDGQARLDGKYLGRKGAERLVKGKSAIEIGGYRLKWK